MIIVVNKKDNLHNDQPYKVYIGRPSPLGNKYSVEKLGRKRCIQIFENDLKAAMLPSIKPYNSDYLRNIKNEIFRLAEIHKKYGKLVLECWCKPKPCHGDVIKQYLEQYLVGEKQ